MHTDCFDYALCCHVSHVNQQHTEYLVRISMPRYAKAFRPPIKIHVFGHVEHPYRSIQQLLSCFDSPNYCTATKMKYKLG